MTREQFDVLVKKAERRYQHRPLALRLKIAGYVLLSYSLFLSWMLLFMVPGILLLWGAWTAEGANRWWLLGTGLVALLGLGAWAGRWFRVKMEPPAGVEIHRVSNPELFTLLDDLSREMRAPRFDHVVVDGRCNAGVVQHPRLGLLGWPRNYLVLGLPLLDCLSAAELRAVLAHEFVHLSAQHGRFGKWIYRLRIAWEKVIEILQQPTHSPGLRKPLLAFIAWLWPRFNAHAFVLSRANEYDADAGAARLTGPEHLASALLRVEFYFRLLEEKTWASVRLEANRSAVPPDDVFETIRRDFATGVPAEKAAQWVEHAFRRATTNADTHPALSDRLRALQFLPADLERGVFPPAPIPPPISATASLLHRVEAEVRGELSRRWQKDVAEHWKETHLRAGVLQHRLDSIDRVVTAAEGDPDSLWEKAQVKMKLESDAAAESLLRQVLAGRPQHVGASFCLGRHLLTSGRDEGAPLLNFAMEEDPELVPPGCELLIEHHRRHGREERIRELMLRLDAHDAAQKASHAEMSSVTASDHFVPHELEDAPLQAIKAWLLTQPEVRTVSIARKELRHFSKQRLFVVVLIIHRKWFGGEEREQELVRAFSRAILLPGRTLVITPRGLWSAVAKKVRRVAEASTAPAR